MPALSVIRPQAVLCCSQLESPARWALSNSGAEVAELLVENRRVLDGNAGPLCFARISPQMIGKKRIRDDHAWYRMGNTFEVAVEVYIRHPGKPAEACPALLGVIPGTPLHLDCCQDQVSVISEASQQGLRLSALAKCAVCGAGPRQR